MTDDIEISFRMDDIPFIATYVCFIVVFLLDVDK